MSPVQDDHETYRLLGRMEGAILAMTEKLDTAIAGQESLSRRIGILENAKARVTGAVAAVVALAGLLGAAAKTIWHALFPGVAA